MIRSLFVCQFNILDSAAIGLAVGYLDRGEAVTGIAVCVGIMVVSIAGGRYFGLDRG